MAAFAFFNVLFFSTPGSEDVPQYVTNVALLAGVWVLGRSLRLRRAYLAELEDRAARLERARGTDARAARVEERSRIPASDEIDFIAYPVTPQVHADDDLSLVETPAAQGETVATAIEVLGLPVAVTPVTLKPRFNPDRPRPAGPAGSVPPETVDPRQMSLLCAGWTVASVKHLAQAGAATVTYYETLGRRGILKRQRPLDGDAEAAFASQPGTTYPVYHVLADLGEWRRAMVVDSVSSDPLRVEMLAVRDAGYLRALLVNLTPETQRAVVAPLPGNRCRSRTLDAHTAFDAAQRPERFRAGGNSLPIHERATKLELPPYAVVRLDAENEATG